jgi:hypothetical protein
MAKIKKEGYSKASISHKCGRRPRGQSDRLTFEILKNRIKL